MNEYGTGTVPTPVEERLRAALAARAQSVGPADLRPLRPPTGNVRTGRLVRRVAVGLLTLAAVAALVFFTVVRGGPDHPAEPAHSPRSTTDTPSAVPSPVRPTTAEPTPSSP
ncbi:hypothetical protein ACFWIO_00485 [Streptomyces diastatochromogenes]|uniref:hypothetical protein n=1 Tax=Streptomyces diastatochromogenes TaxID=42236 RepID=UPI00365C7A47